MCSAIPRGSCVCSIKQIFHSQPSDRSSSMCGSHTAAGSSIDPVKALTYKLALCGPSHTSVCADKTQANDFLLPVLLVFIIHYLSYSAVAQVQLTSPTLQNHPDPGCILLAVVLALNHQDSHAQSRIKLNAYSFQGMICFHEVAVIY